MNTTTFDHNQFNELGYTCVEGVFGDAELQPVFDEYGDLLDRLASRWHETGALNSTYTDLPFEERFLRITRECSESWSQHFDCSLPQAGIRHDTPIHLGQALFNVLRNDRLLDLAEEYVGSEIYSTPIQHIRIKPPESALADEQQDGLSTTSPWHQDQGVARPEADDVRVLTVWIALTDATEENGCLCVIPRSHHKGLVDHCPNRGGAGQALEIPPSLRTEEPLPLPVRRGSVIFLHHLTMHASLPNKSNDVRWSLDLRYQPIGTASGRPVFPGFVARSQRDPSSELTDVNAWRQSWLDARSQLAETELPNFNRWKAGATICE